MVTVKSVAGKPISQVVIGSSANPGLRDFWIVSQIVKNQTAHPDVSFDINPSSRQKIEELGSMGALNDLIVSGARYHQTGCMGCIGMGQAPASGSISLRTMPRNFPGRSGTADDNVYLCSPETAAVSALTGKITDPVEYGKNKIYPQFIPPLSASVNTMMLLAPSENNKNVQLVKGPNIKSLPDFEKIEDSFKAPVILKMGDNISTDEILKAGAEVLPLRSNIDAISKYAYYALDKDFINKASQAKESLGGHIVVAGENYAQGSSREHAAIAPRYLGQKAVIAKSYARIGFRNLVNYGIIPFVFENPDDYTEIGLTNIMEFKNIISCIQNGTPLSVYNSYSGKRINVFCNLTQRQRKILIAGGLINYVKSNKNH